MRELDLVCQVITPFTIEGTVDEPELRRHLQRMRGERVGVSVGSPGAGEGNSLSEEELGRIYAIAVGELRGHVTVQALAREGESAEGTARYARIAAAAGVDVVGVFPLERHGMIPTREEQDAYYSEIVGAVDTPFALSLHGAAGYLPPIDLIAELCGRTKKIVQLDVHDANSRYLLELREATPRSVRIGVGLGSATTLEGIAFGASIFDGSLSNVIPHTARALLDACERSDLDAAAEQIRRIARFSSIVKPWSTPTARAIKMCLSVLGLPGGNGRTRPPIILPGHDQRAKLSAMLDGAGVRSWEGIAV